MTSFLKQKNGLFLGALLASFGIAIRSTELSEKFKLTHKDEFSTLDKTFICHLDSKPCGNPLACKEVTARVKDIQKANPLAVDLPEGVVIETRVTLVCDQCQAYCRLSDPNKGKGYHIFQCKKGHDICPACLRAKVALAPSVGKKKIDITNDHPHTITSNVNLNTDKEKPTALASEPFLASSAQEKTGTTDEKTLTLDSNVMLKKDADKDKSLAQEKKATQRPSHTALAIGIPCVFIVISMALFLAYKKGKK